MPHPSNSDPLIEQYEAYPYPARDPAANPNYPHAPYYDGNIGFRGLWEAWNSGALAPNLGACGTILYFGGGHNDYWGNEVIGLDLCGGANAGPPVLRNLAHPA